MKIKITAFDKLMMAVTFAEAGEIDGFQIISGMLDQKQEKGVDAANAPVHLAADRDSPALRQGNAR